MKQLICLSQSPWIFTPSRTQHLMSRLRDAQILYFEPSGPWGSSAHRGKGRKVRPGLTAYTLPPVLDLSPKQSLLFRRQQRQLGHFIAARAEKHHFRDCTLWVTTPEQVHLLPYIPHQGLVYDCAQEYPHLPPEWERDLALEAEVVFAASPGLADRLDQCSGNVALLPNGVNYPMFCRERLEIPPALDALPSPRLGYLGPIHRDTDLSPALQAALDFPECSFLFLGEVESNPLLTRLRALPNVSFLGPWSAEALPECLSAFDVCLNFLRRSEAGSDIIPERLYQYLSTGKPIVSMLWEDQVERFPDVVYGAHSPEEFSTLCNRALNEVGDWTRRRRREYGAGATWSARAEEVAHILETIGLY